MFFCIIKINQHLNYFQKVQTVSCRNLFTNFYCFNLHV